MFKFYDKIEEDGTKSIPEILKTYKKIVSREQVEKLQRYFQTHKYILSTLTPNEAKTVILRFGIGDDRYRSLAEIGELMNLSRERIRQIENKAIRKLRHPDRIKLLSRGITDADVVYDADGKLDLNKMYSNSFETLSDEQLEAKRCLETIFVKIKLENMTLKEFLSKDKRYIIENNLEDMEQKIRSYGLHFYNEAKYTSEWLNMCYEDIIRIGIDNIYDRLELYHVRLSNGERLVVEDRLHIPIEDMGLSVRVCNALRRNNIRTFRDILKMTKSKLLTFSNLGPITVDEIIAKMKSYNVDLCPGDMNPDEWLLIMESKVAGKKLESKLIKTSSKRKTLSFEDLLNIPLEKMDLSVRALNSLRRHNIRTLGDCVKLSIQKLGKIREFGAKSIRDTIARVEAFGMSICPENVDPDEWIKELETKYINKTMLNTDDEGDTVDGDDGLKF